MDRPISPPSARGAVGSELPAYVANGVIGLRVREVPLTPGMTLVNGFAGEHPVRRVEAAAVAPYPCAGDLCVDGVWLSDAPHQVEVLDQAYDFSCGELTSRFAFAVGEVRALVEVVTFCDRDEPSLVCQEVTVRPNGACDLRIRASVDGGGIDGRPLRQLRETPGEPEPVCDGALLWESAGGLATCGIAYVTELLGAGEVDPDRPPLSANRLTTEYGFRGRGGRAYRLRQVASLLSSEMHGQPDQQAVRLVALARRRGFEDIRRANRAVWADLWEGRIHLVGAGDRWQGLADAAYFYLLCSTHTASPASTSIFGLATWHDYHYYFGHVMWDIETFVTPVLSLLQPAAAESLLDYRFRHLDAAASNARLRGRRGLQFPWESAPSSGEECAPMPGSASWHEDHVSLDVARAFALHSHITGDATFLRDRAWPVLSGVAKWAQSRVCRSRRGYEVREAMGIAERVQASDNPAFTNMSIATVMRDAIAAAETLSLPADSAWSDIARRMALPMRGRILVSHDGYRTNEEKGGTPDPLMGLFPLDYPLDEEVRAATLAFYLDRAQDYIGSPMLSALYGVWAAYAGDRGLAARLMEEGYGRFCAERFWQTLEYRPDVFPEQPRAGPFFANLGGFLSSLLLGFPGLQPGSGDPRTWARRPVILPPGWKAIEAGRLYVHGRPARLTARHGDERAALTW
jgi:protein-glucosylgalactosylhydroxylysine glucosidase